MLKILMLAPLPPPSGGIASWTVRFKEYCEKHSVNLRIVDISLKGERATKETMKRNLKVEFYRSIRIIRDLKTMLQEEKPSVIHLNTSCSSLGILRDALCAFFVRGGVPIVLHCRCNVVDQLGTKWASQIAFNYLVKKANVVIVLNDESKDYVERIDKGKAIFIPNFIDKKMVAKNHNINSEIKNVLYVGHIERAKGIERLAEVAKFMPNKRFFLVGAVTEDLSEIEFSNNVYFTGRVSIKEVKKQLEEADIFVFPSTTEGFSNALLEAMAMGVPIIASDVGANSEMIEGKGGIIIEENSVEKLYEAIVKIGDPQLRTEMSKWNINKVNTSYIVDSVMKMYFDVYENLIK